MCPDPIPDPGARPKAPVRARGAVTIELALAMTVFLMLVFGSMEVARALFLVNTVQEVTRAAARAASVTDFSDGAAMAALRERALFGSGAGTRLPLAPNLGTANLRIEYLSQDADGNYVQVAALPECPRANLANCAQDPHGASCIRFVRAGICANAAGPCTPLPYQPMTGLAPGFAGMALPVSATLVKAEMLGYRPGVNNCPTP